MSIRDWIWGRPRPDPTPPPTVISLPAAEPPEPVEPDIPAGVRTAAGWAWRLLLFGVFVVALYQVLAYFSAITVPLAAGILVAALLHPMIVWLERFGWRPGAAAGVSLLTMILVVAGLVTLVGAQVVAEAPLLVDRTLDGISQVLDWLTDGPLRVQASELDEWWRQIKDWVTNSREEIAKRAAAVGTRVGAFFAGLLIALTAAYYFGAQGTAIMSGCVRLCLPTAYQERVESAAIRGWASLVGYMRASMIVAAVDAAGVALAALLLGVPMVTALFVITFLLSFVPVLGAVVAGTIAVALALVTQGWLAALIMLGATIVVTQAEGNLLQPMLLGKAADLHPLVVLLALTAGAAVNGVVGVLLAIPLVAFAVAFGKALRAPESPAPPVESDAAG